MHSSSTRHCVENVCEICGRVCRCAEDRNQRIAVDNYCSGDIIPVETLTSEPWCHIGVTDQMYSINSMLFEALTALTRSLLRVLKRGWRTTVFQYERPIRRNLTRFAQSGQVGNKHCQMEVRLFWLLVQTEPVSQRRIGRTSWIRGIIRLSGTFS